MTHEGRLYYVVILKGEYICGTAAGPFLSTELAEEAIPTLREISRSCSYGVASHTIDLTIGE